MTSRPKISVVQSDIVLLDVDAIVNAANSSLLGGGGVDGAIHRAAGPQLLAECRTLAGCPAGEAKLTGGYRLHARYVIHTVGPVWQGGQSGEPATLAACYRNCLRLALQHGIRTLAFPAISCGVYGYPVNQAAAIAIEEVMQYPADAGSLQQVTFVCFSETVLKAYLDALAEAAA